MIAKAGSVGRAGALRVQVSLAAVLFVLLVGALCAWSLWRSRADAIGRAEARAANLSLLLAGNVASAFERADIALGETAAQLERELAGRGIDRDALWTLVDAGTALVPAISRIGVFDAEGHQVCGVPASRCLHLDVSDRPYFGELRARPAGAARLYGPYASRFDGRSTLVLARALRGPGGRFAGLVIALVPLQHFAQLLAAADLGEGGAAALCGPDLALLLRNPPLNAPAPGAPSDELRQAVRAAPAQGGYRGRGALDGIERQNAYQRLAPHGLYVVVGLATREFLAPWRLQAAWLGGFFLLAAASALLITRLVLRGERDRRRIQRLYDEAPCGYHSLDAAGRYRHINSTELHWLGCTRDEVVGRLGLADFLTPQGAQDFRRNFELLMADGQVEGREYELHGRNGQVRHVLVSARAVRDRAGRFLMSNSVMHDITELHEARQALRRFADELEARVEQRTRELRTLAAELDAAEGRERHQLSRDLHDDLGQTLAAARLHLGALDGAAQPEVRAVAARVDALLARANLSTRSLAAQLAPPMLDELGLPEALEWLGEEIERSFGLKVSVVDDGRAKPLSRQARSILYRATRELLINAAKHAQAESAEVEIERDRDRDSIVVRVSDGGVGFDPQLLGTAPGQGLGLLSVRERLGFIGGSVALESIPGDGTMATLRAPLAEAANEAVEP